MVDVEMAWMKKQLVDEVGVWIRRQLIYGLVWVWLGSVLDRGR